ncbi:ATP phosphoribosyltransferase regulatory subunit [Aestuariirhabdus litorea]|uniref:ATP phosphoribosyltransferase regulatory subunit n=1 Tax=Aestuariirhabdus litorea TaxID=2528527 RepID=A0A3P3VHW4_9GAMM|nr:ATP phosphoribosyltransferase regulatory subunit [Aestuariirhabdus litorea]RRJ82310.1 ATP phosphoribosyltransferase regulatory subunit [Aestuariirhabdus litorea]RWW92475.1 ATP phosphoribosyltransferase regulatory subunit [Endozoicomonadaceae bacterium GTF-13]
MTIADRWLLPDGIDEVLPAAAQQVERLRRELLDLYSSWGYELVIPPHIEYLESLQAGAGHDLDLQTFKVVDQLTGRMMGLRADTTPSVARIDAHTLRREGPVRLCYCGSVFHTKASASSASRSPIQLGAELYGHAGFESDVEVISLMLTTLKHVGQQQINVDIGHAGIFRGLMRESGLDADQQERLFDALQRKANPEVQALVAEGVNDPAIAEMLCLLPHLNGDISILADAGKRLAGAPADVRAALVLLEQIAAGVQQAFPEVSLYFDLSELSGYNYNYHTGVVFAAYLPGSGQAIAKGGRYDGIGAAFGRARPATGFSTDLKLLLGLMVQETAPRSAIFAPQGASAELVQGLRAQGERVIYELPGQSQGAAELGCNRRLVETAGGWQIEPVEQ